MFIVHKLHFSAVSKYPTLHMKVILFSIILGTVVSQRFGPHRVLGSDTNLFDQDNEDVDSEFVFDQDSEPVAIYYEFGRKLTPLAIYSEFGRKLTAYMSHENMSIPNAPTASKSSKSKQTKQTDSKSSKRA